jgi:hypothetical protein
MAKFLSLSPIPPACYQMTLLVELPELWWISQVFPSADIIIPAWFSMLMYHPEDEQ